MKMLLSLSKIVVVVSVLALFAFENKTSRTGASTFSDNPVNHRDSTSGFSNPVDSRENVSTEFSRALTPSSKTKEVSRLENAPLLAGENLILNPEFDQGTTNWALGDYSGPGNTNGGSSFSAVTGAGLSGTNALYVDVVNTSNSWWTLQVYQTLNFRLELGKTYEITFTAKGQTARPMGVALRGLTSNTDIWSTSMNLTTGTQTFGPFQYVCNNASVNGESGFSLAFYLANGVISDVWIDNAIVRDITNVAVTGVSVSPTALSLSPGQTGQLAGTVAPANATNPSVTWSSSNTSIATVNTTGLVTAVAVGSATITATSVSSPTISGTSSVTVNTATGPTPLISLRFNETSGVPVNTGTLSSTFTRSATTPLNSTNVPTGGGDRSLDFGTTTGNFYAESAGVIDGLKNLSSFTITGWMNIRNNTIGSGGNRIVSWINGGGDGVDLVYNGNGSLGMGIDQWPDTSPATSTAGKVTFDAGASAANWVFFAATYQSTTNEVKYYFGNNGTDAALDVTRTYDRGLVGTNTAKLAIGHFNDATRSSATDRMLRGLVDEIQIHGSALTLTQIVGIQRANSTIAVTSVSVSPTTLTLTPGQTGQLTGTVAPANATNPTVTWSSSNTSIATVNSSGLVTAGTVGSATITATSVSNPTISGTSSVTVNAAPGPAPLIALRFNETSGVPVNTGTLSSAFTRSATTPLNSTNVPTGGGDRSLDFGTTTGNFYAESAGVIDGLKNLSSFTITGWMNIRNNTIGSGGNRIVSWINGGGDGVDLVYNGNGSLGMGIDQWPDTSPATSTAGKVTFDAGASATNWVFFAATYQSTTNEVKYYFGNNSTDATLDVTRTYNRGLVGTNTAKLAIGHFNDATRSSATDRMLRGLVDEIQIHGSALTLTQIVGIQRANSTIAVTGVSVLPSALTLTPGQTGQLTGTIAPSNATNPSVTWNSSNPSIATVNSSGLVSAVAVGSATITATTVDGGFTATSSVTVQTGGSISVTGVSLSPSPLSLNPGQTGQLTRTIVPANATNQNVTWNSSNPSIATVNTTGLVTAVANGVATITVTTVQGGFTATSLVQVGGSNEVVIPPDLIVSRDRKPTLPLVERGPFTLASLSVGTIQQVFQAPPCLEGRYYAAFQLYYDLGNTQTQQDWTTDLTITLLNNTTALWTKTLSVKSSDQTFISTVFHDALLLCDPNYRIRIDARNINGTAPQSNIYLKVLLYKYLEDVFVPTASASLNCSNASERSTISWTYTGKAAIAYDLEWVFIAGHENFTGTTPQQAFLFKEPVRVTTSALSYVHATYYPTGKLAYRIRAIGYNPLFPDHRIPGNWFYGPCGLITINNHQPDMNWQEQTVFAEDGKHKKIMNYYDGSLRERQSQTSLSTSSDTTLVGETFYDYEGRQAIDVLAVPSSSVSLKYKPSFNPLTSQNATVTSKTSAKRKKFHYDNDVLENSIAAATSGAGLYYSPGNNLNAFRKDYIPDAEGYVFSQTEYLNDGTGRVKRQSGVGKEFKMDGAGRPTKSYYGSAAPQELIRLFGSNVGNASHYKKNMMVDPNGQASVSYLDQEGRVVATALAGANPANVNALDSYTALPTAQLVVDVSSKNKKRDGASINTHKILNTIPNTTYSFVYDFSALGSTIENIGCVSCTYDLNISIADPDGALVTLPAIAGNQAANNLSYERKGLTVADCINPATALNVQFPVNFAQPGDYTVTKILVPTELTFDQAKVIISQSATVQTKIQDIQNSYTVDASNCEICTSCPEADAAINNAITEIADKDCQNIYQRIVQALRDAVPNDYEYYPTEAQITAHPDYCQYTLCLGAQSGDIFEKEMSRATNWTEALGKGYQNLSNLASNPYPDPYFRAGAPGASYTASLQNKLNSIYIATVGYDSNGDGVQDGTNDYTGTILQVTDPANTTFYIDQNGNHTTSTVTGKHILYYDLMSRRKANQLSESNYQSELLKHRWTLFKSFYQEAKRKTRLEIPAVQNCPAEKARLEAPDLFPVTDEGIREYGNQNGVTVPISAAEVDAIYSSITFNCTNKNISAADKLTIETRLKNYFDEKPVSLFRFILTTDIGSNSHLNAIQTLLNTYGCGSLSAIAVADPFTCLNDSTIIVKNKFVHQTGGILTAFYNAYREDVENQKQPKSHNHEIKTKTLSGKRIFTKKNNSTSPLVAPLPSLAEYNALIAFYNSTGGPNWTNKLGWATANPNVVQDVSGWRGVEVDAQGHVIGLNLPFNNLVGTIPSSINNLTFLQKLVLPSNQLTGTIQTTIGSLNSLINLDLAANQLTGAIPLQIGQLSNLERLVLNHNQLTGPIPGVLGNLIKMDYLMLHVNQLTGQIPTEIGALTNLTSLSLYYNQLTGSIPPSLGNLIKLNYLWLNNNQLSGTIPSVLGNLINLSQLQLSSNSLTGSIPSSLGNLLNLEILSLNNNLLTGTIPTTFGNLQKLVNLWLASNQLTGSIPIEICSLPMLQMLMLQYNQLSGQIPSQIGSLGNLTHLGLNNNILTGAIPGQIGALTKLQNLMLFFNQLTGSLPNEICDLTNLTNLIVDFNQLSGEIPADIGRLTKLVQLSLQYNNFSGIVPSGLSSLTNLQRVNLTLNHFQGDLSGALSGSLNTLDFIHIQGNRFTFSDLISLTQNFTGTTFLFVPQDSVDIRKNLPVSVSNSLTLTTNIDRTTSPASTYQWFQFINSSSSVALNTASTTGHTVVLSNITAADLGKKYYYKITNTAAPGLTLVSRLQTIVNDTKTITFCKEYDSNNPTLQQFSFTIDYNQVVQKCMADAAAENTILIEYATEKLIEEEATVFYSKYRTNCLASANEKLTFSYVPKEYHYTLYYYDQAGNLAQTVPPQGVKPLTPAQVTAFLTGSPTEPLHTFLTRYQYNSLNQSVYQKTPDAGESRFFYNDKGQLKLSQNAQQLKDNNYSYTKYDVQGRIAEVGEMNTTTLLATLITQLEDINFPLSASYTLSDVTRTYYDLPNTAIQATFPQENLRSRVAWVEVLEKNAPDVIATYYTYDIHGNVKSLLQQVPGLENKRTDYVYELVSGNVNYVMYQYGQPDQFIHRYKYDADNRLKEVATSNDGYLWDVDAAYRYYLHGPLARVELGQYRVQGLDYYYTLQGWVKGVNMPYAADPANDGYAGANLRVGRDVFSYAIGYYENDYKPRNAARVISDSRDQMWARFKTLMGSTNTGLFNGNISWMITDLKKIGQQKGARVKGMQAMLYKYDQLNRIVQSRSLTTYAAATGFATRTATPAAYDEDFSYDANGNILTLKRRDNAAALQDDFTYSYYTNTNKLRYHIPILRDTVYSGAIASNNKAYRRITVQGTAFAPANKDVVIKAIENIDIDEGFDIQSNATFRAYVLPDEEGAYNYDAIGNLIWDQGQGVRIEWTPYGKVRKVNKGDGTVITFRYDGAGNRIEKKMVKADATTTITRYIRDASGNVMGVYNGTVLLEQSIYGSGRLGLYKGGRSKAQRKLGSKNYELSNHLGNVLSVITDNIRMIPDSTWATVVSANDYYAFGSGMVGRNFEDNTYRYGFNGKEKDDKGELGDTHYDYGFRIYDPSIGRFKSRDPLASSYPWYTPFQFAGNSPIMAIDVDGLEDQIAIDGSTVSGPFDMEKINGEVVRQQVNTAKQAMSQQPIRSPRATTFIGPDPSKGEGSAAYNYKRSKAIYEANLKRLENHFTPEEKAMQLGVDIAGVVEGGYGLYKVATKVPKYFKSFATFSKASSSTARLAEGGIDIFDAIRNNYLPGARGANIGGTRLSDEAMSALSNEFGVEFAQVYFSGMGKNGGGGYYMLYSGTAKSVDIPKEIGSFLINHTHPGGTAQPSIWDVNYLIDMEALKSPQRSSIILPKDKPAVKFDKNTPTIKSTPSIE